MITLIPRNLPIQKEKKAEGIRTGIEKVPETRIRTRTAPRSTIWVTESLMSA